MVENLRQNINLNSENLARLQDQLSSGMRLRRPSDDPQAVSRALSLRTTSAQYTQYLRNISSARGWLEATDTALDQMSTALRQARDVALRGSTDTLDDDALRALGAQVDSYLQEALEAANASHGGKYLFAGFQVGPGSPPFEISGVTIVYNGDSGSIEREISAGIRLGINITGDSTVGGDTPIIDGLQAMLDIRDQLLSGNKVTSAQLGQLTTALEEMPSIRGLVGARMQRIDETESAIKGLQSNVAVMLSREQDADVAEVMTKLMMQESVYRAALNIGARVIQPSLLDFLR